MEYPSVLHPTQQEACWCRMADFVEEVSKQYQWVTGTQGALLRIERESS